MSAKTEIYGVKRVILTNEGHLPLIATACFSRIDGCIYIHLGGAHGDNTVVQPHQQRDATIHVIDRPKMDAPEHA